VFLSHHVSNHIFSICLEEEADADADGSKMEEFD